MDSWQKSWADIEGSLAHPTHRQNPFRQCSHSNGGQLIYFIYSYLFLMCSSSFIVNLVILKLNGPIYPSKCETVNLRIHLLSHLAKEVVWNLNSLNHHNCIFICKASRQVWWHFEFDKLIKNRIALFSYDKFFLYSQRFQNISNSFLVSIFEHRFIWNMWLGMCGACRFMFTVIYGVRAIVRLIFTYGSRIDSTTINSHCQTNKPYNIIHRLLSAYQRNSTKNKII